MQQQQVPSQVLTQSVEYRDAGIILTVTPRISDKRVVALDVKQTVNDVGDPRPPSLSPDIIKREAETSVVLRDNQTLVLGGLIRTRRASTKQGIPWLSKIPVIGFLFGSTVDRIERTELLLLITPRVIGDPSEGQEILQQVRGQRPGLEKDLRRPPEHPPAGDGAGDTMSETLAAPAARPRRWSARVRHSVTILAIAALLAACEGGSGQSGSAFVFLTVDGFSLSGGANTATVNSSIDTGTTTTACVTLRNNLKNPTITTSNALDNVIVQSYTVTLTAVSGGGLPGPFTFGTAVLVPAGTRDERMSSAATRRPSRSSWSRRGRSSTPASDRRISSRSWRRRRSPSADATDAGNSVEAEGAVTVVFMSGRGGLERRAARAPDGQPGTAGPPAATTP